MSGRGVPPPDGDAGRHTDPLSALVRLFLDSNLSIILIIVSLAAGAAALLVTPREEDPQIVVPLADVFVSFPGHSAAEVEQLVTTPLERILYQIDGVEYVYSMSQPDQAVVTVRFYVGQDRERSLVKLFAKLGEHADRIAPGVTGWVMKPVEIDDVPVVTLAVVPKAGAGDGHQLRRVAEELVERLSVVPQVSRAAVIGGEPRIVRVEPTIERMAAYGVDPAAVARAIAVSTAVLPAGRMVRDDQTVAVEGGHTLGSAADLGRIVVGVSEGRPVRLSDVATVEDGPADPTDFVRHGWGPARGFAAHHGGPGTLIGGAGGHAAATAPDQAGPEATAPAVTIAISKQRGSNAVTVAASVIERAEALAREVLPSDMELVVTRNAGLTADEKVNELVEALVVALVIVVALLTVTMGWQEAFVVAVAVPVVFGLTLAVNLLAGYTINRVTLFALILALGMLVDDPIVDVENIARHFEERKRASRGIVLDAVAEIRPPLISATLAVIVSFLPLFAITGMMGPYMSPMALGVPVAMLMSMVVAFTITPWLAYHVLGRRFGRDGADSAAAPAGAADAPVAGTHGLYDVEATKRTLLYRLFRPLMLPLVRHRAVGIAFLLLTAVATVAAAGMGALRMVPLKMLPFDNKNELLFLVDMDEGTSLERTRAVVSRLERALADEPEVVDFTSHTGVAGPIDFNGLVRHYGLRSRPNLAEVRVNLVGKKQRRLQSHALGLRLRDRLEAVGREEGALVRIVELPPGPPVLSSIVAEVRGGADARYDDLLGAADMVAERLRQEPAVVEVDTGREAGERRLVFELDQEKAALSGVSAVDVATAIRTAVAGDASRTLTVEGERNPLRIVVRLPEPQRSAAADLGQVPVRSQSGSFVPLVELGGFSERRVDQTIHHKNLDRVVYVTAECTSRPPAECVVDVMADRDATQAAPGRRATYLSPGSGIPWSVPPGIDVSFAGEGEWKITLDVFRDLGIAFGAALAMIYVILVAQTGSFSIPVVVMLAIPLTLLGVMPGFWLLDRMAGGVVGGHADPVFFTATAMIGMIALAGIVTRDSIILVDFIELAMRHGRPMLDAILESRVVRLRPILLTAGAALLSAVPITLDPIFSGLGWSLIFGLVASTLFTLFVIPVSYRLLRGGD